MTKTMAVPENNVPMVTQITDLRGLSAGEIRRRVRPLTMEKKADLLSQAVFGSVEHIFWSACIATEIEDSGGETNLIFGRWYRLMAEEQLSPEVFVRLAGKPRLLEKVVELPLKEQERLIVKGEPVKLGELNAAGQVEFRQFRLTELDPRFYRLVFGDDGIQSEGQQAAILRYEANRELPPVPLRQPVEIESLLEEVETKKRAIQHGDKRQQKKAARELCLLAEKIALLVQ